MKLLANKVHIQGMEVLLADKVNYCDLRRDGCMCETYSHN